MPSPKRSWNLVYILVPNASIENRDGVLLGRAACRVAFQMKFIPIFPLLYNGGFLTEEELDRQLTQESWRWLKRAGRIWLCSQTEHPELDPLSHDILLNNEGLLLARPRSCMPCPIYAKRLPVYWFSPGYDGEAVKVTVMERSDIGLTLRRNITSGLFRGVAI